MGDSWTQPGPGHVRTPCVPIIIIGIPVIVYECIVNETRSVGGFVKRTEFL